MKKIVLALALAAVTPAVLVAQENGNAYNQSKNEVIASNTRTEASSVNYGVEGKALYHADLALAKIRANRIAKEKEAKTQTPVQTQAPAQEPQATTLASKRVNIDDSYFHTGREGHMMALGHGWNNNTKHDTTPVPTYVKEADTLSHNHQVVVNADSSNKSVKKRNSAFRRYAHEIAQSIIRNAQNEK